MREKKPLDPTVIFGRRVFDILFAAGVFDKFFNARDARIAAARTRSKKKKEKKVEKL